MERYLLCGLPLPLPLPSIAAATCRCPAVSLLAPLDGTRLGPIGDLGMVDRPRISYPSRPAAGWFLLSLLVGFWTRVAFSRLLLSLREVLRLLVSGFCQCRIFGSKFSSPPSREPLRLSPPPDDGAVGPIELHFPLAAAAATDERTAWVVAVAATTGLTVWVGVETFLAAGCGALNPACTACTGSFDVMDDRCLLAPRLFCLFTDRGLNTANDIGLGASLF